MRALIILVITSVVWVVVCSSPIDPTRRLIYRPRDHEEDFRRSPQVKGGIPGVKGYNPPMPSLRKGEYICGNKVCMLKPGEIPPGCNGVCQYRVS